MRLAYADPPYPGKAHLYPENTEVDHAALIEQLREYEGWALSTDERNLRYVLGLCPTDVRILAWGKRNAMTWPPQPYAAWEPVLLSPARLDRDAVPSFLLATAPVTNSYVRQVVGQKPPEFCDWVIRCLGAQPTDSLDDLFPGSGAFRDAWDRFANQLTITMPPPAMQRGGAPRVKELRRWNQPFPAIGVAPAPRERES